MISLQEIEWAKSASKGLLEKPANPDWPRPKTNEELINQLLQEGPSRKHFRQVADIIKTIRDPAEKQRMAQHHADIFASQNKNFNHKKWHEWIGTKSHVFPDENKRKWGAGHDTYMGDETDHAKETLQEVTPPGKGFEHWVKGRKAGFKERYGNKWKSVLYATAWKMKKKHPEGISNESYASAAHGKYKADLLRKKQGSKIKNDNDPKERGSLASYADRIYKARLSQLRSK